MVCVLTKGDNKGTYFSRDIDNSLSGTKPWGKRETPFFLKEGQKPSKIQLGIRFEGPGIIWIDDARLTKVFMKSSSGEEPSWGGIFGSIFGVTVGLWGAIVGIMGSKGKARGFVIGSSYALVGICALLFIAGGTMFFIGSDFSFWYPPVLCGFIGAAIIGFNIPGIKRRYIDIETRKLCCKRYVKF